MEVSGQLHDPAALPPGPIVYEAGWAQDSVWTLWKREKSCTAGNGARAVQHVARRYSD
jgi:hypothetical protein